MPTSQTQLEKRLLKKPGLIEKSTLKTAPTTVKPKINKPQPPKSIKPNNDEPDVDVENAPVIQGSFEGSFEITKTDADIARKRTTPVKTATPYPLRVKSKKPTIEKVPSPTSSTTTGSTATTTTSTTTITEPTTTTSTTTTTTTDFPINIPQLDINLFTSPPIIDTNPWRPIRPPNSEQYYEVPRQSSSSSTTTSSTTSTTVAPPQTTTTKLMSTQSDIEAVIAGLLPTATPEVASNAHFYNSFINPIFKPGTAGIEKLGNTNVRPHPLPVPLLDEVVVPAFKPLNPVFASNDKISFQIETGNDRFEHIGGGVIVKKHDMNETRADTTAIDNLVPPPTSPGQVEEDRNKEPTNIGDFILDLLSEDSPNEFPLKVESRVDTDSGESIPEDSSPAVDSIEESKKPNFMNLKEVVLSRLNNSSPESHFPQNNRNRIKAKPLNASSEDSQQRTNSPSTLSDEMLFPSHSKWELINGSAALESVKQPASMRKVFNKTLQAWVVQDAVTTKPVNALEELKLKISNAENIEDITAIFDNLATKLGFTQPNPGKNPPFSMNKLKEMQQFHATSSTNPPPPSTTTSPTTTTRTTLTTPRIKSSSSGEIEEGEAEVEVVDPNKYEDLLKLSSQMITSSTERIPPTLVTLLPVRSNSGIRTFKPISEDNSPTSFSSDTKNEGRAETDSITNIEVVPNTPPTETVVKTGLNITV